MSLYSLLSWLSLYVSFPAPIMVELTLISVIMFSVCILTPAVWSLCRNSGSVAWLMASNSIPVLTSCVTWGSFTSHLCEVG